MMTDVVVPPKKKKNPGRSARRRLRNRREQQQQQQQYQAATCSDQGQADDVDGAGAKQNPTLPRSTMACHKISTTAAAAAAAAASIDTSFLTPTTANVPGNGNMINHKNHHQNDSNKNLHSSGSNNHPSWRSDREISLPSVLLLRQQEQQPSQSSSSFGLWNPTRDPRYLRNQLGFVPGNAIAIVARVNPYNRISKQQQQQQQQQQNGQTLSIEQQKCFDFIWQQHQQRTTKKPPFTETQNPPESNDCNYRMEKRKKETEVATAVVSSKCDYVERGVPLDIADDDTQNDDDDDEPLVLQLYPLACRDSYAGGKTKGRHFKGRRRGPSQQQQQQQKLSQQAACRDPTRNLKEDGQVLTTESPECIIAIKSNEPEPKLLSSNNAQPDDKHDTTTGSSTIGDDEQQPSTICRTDSAGTGGTEANPPCNSIMDQPISRSDGSLVNNTTMEVLVVEPFPTMYWLTHPWLRTMVSQLELEHYGTTLEQRLANDPEAMASMQRAHLAYGHERFQLLSQEDITKYLVKKNKNSKNRNTTSTTTSATTSATEVASPSSWEEALSPQRGVAGIRNFGSVKCLHAHVAHYLSGGSGSHDNIIGKWTMDAVMERINYSMIGGVDAPLDEK